MAYLQRLTVNGLRNLQAPDLHIHEQQPLLITGDNGSGKTALLEAIFLLSTGRSFRESRIQRCQQWQATTLTLYAEVHNQQGTHHLGWQKEKQTTRLRLNGDNASNQATLAQYLPVQVFSPENQDKLTQGPSERRRFIDWGAFYHNKQFLGAWRAYQHALKQRNHALKQQRPNNELLLWQAPLAAAAAQVDQIRHQYIDALTKIATPLLTMLSSDLADIQIDYYPGWDQTQHELAQLWESQLSQDRQLGFTHAGPHRADLKLRLHGRDALSILSRGQQKLLTLALLLAQSSCLKEKTNESPVLLLDDLTAELDRNHIQRFLECLPSLKAQTVLTAIDSSHLPLESKQHWHIQSGNIQLVEQT